MNDLKKIEKYQVQPLPIEYITDTTLPMNFKTAEKWQAINNTETLINIVQHAGIRISQWFDGLVFRSLKDARGNYDEWQTLFIYGIKK